MAQSRTDSTQRTVTIPQADMKRLLDAGKQRDPAFVTPEEIQQMITGADSDSELQAMVEAELDQRGVLVTAAPPSNGGELDEDVVAEVSDDEARAVLESSNLAEDLSDALLGDSVRLYLREIGQVPLLTPEQEQQVARTIAAGQRAVEELEHIAPDDPRIPELRRLAAAGYEARQQMAAANLRLVVSIAKRYRERGLPLLDLIQEGSLGLLRAIEKFDVDKGFKFSTYATWWIKQALSRALADQSRLVRLPVHLGETLNRIQSLRRQLTQQHGREPTDHELAQALDMTVEKLRELRRTAQDPVSLATPVGEEADSTLADFIPDPHALDADDAAASGMLRDQIASALHHLSERERRVLELRYGLSDGQPRTLEEVGKEFGVTRERVRQIEVKALRKLRHPRLGKLLRDFLEQN